MTHRILPFALAFVLLAAATPRAAHAQSAAPERMYTILIFERQEDLARRNSTTDGASYWNAYNEFAGALMKAGALRAGSALADGRVLTARGEGGADAGVRGAKLGGYFVIEAASPAEALRLAKLAPSFAVTVEVRPHQAKPTATMSP
jgi:hypothetical protein